MKTTEQKASVYYNDELAGSITKSNEGYVFTYDEKYFIAKDKPAISLSFPKNIQTYNSKYLFPFFFGLLSEGVNKEIQCRTLKIDEKDYFTRLIKTAGTNTIGAVTLREVI